MSSCLSHGSYFVTSALYKVLKNQFFDKFNTLKIWSDNTKNLKSYELASFFYNLSTKKTISWSFFTQYHVKSICDCRFSWISSALESYSSTNKGEIKSTNDVFMSIKLKENQSKNFNKTSHQIKFKINGMNHLKSNIKRKIQYI